METFYFIAKVISSCKTYEQLDTCWEWVSTKRGIDMDQFFMLRSHILDKKKTLGSGV